MNPARFRWGVLFILVGGLLLCNNIGLLDWWVWEDILALWPLILIAIGVEKIFAKSKLAVVSYLAPVALAAAVVYVAFSGMTLDNGVTRGDGTVRSTITREADMTRLEVDFELKDTDLAIRQTTGDDVFRGRFSRGSNRPDVDYDVNDGLVKIDVKESSRMARWWYHSDRDRRSDWLVRLSDKLPLRLTSAGDKADMTIDARSLLLEEVNINSDDGDIRLYIGDLSENVKVTLDGSDGDFNLYVPPNCGMRVVNADADLYRIFTRFGLENIEGDFQSVGYDSLTPKIDLSIDPEITKFSINTY